jgi:hypothetical protein
MPDIDPHNHEEYEVTTNVICMDCGKNEVVCAMCGESLHKCEKAVTQADARIMRGYKVIPEFPDYMVNNQATVRHISSERLCLLVRVSKSGGAMINLRKNGKPYTRAAQDLRDQAFSVTT